MNINDTKERIEIFWSFLGGLFFSMLPLLLSSGAPGNRRFNLMPWLDSTFFESGRHGFFDEFLFGAIITYLIIWTIKKYRSLS